MRGGGHGRPVYKQLLSSNILYGAWPTGRTIAAAKTPTLPSQPLARWRWCQRRAQRATRCCASFWGALALLRRAPVPASSHLSTRVRRWPHSVSLGIRDVVEVSPWIYGACRVPAPCWNILQVMSRQHGQTSRHYVGASFELYKSDSAL